uniref:Uncharacterized protein n=2 Tax=Clytia hemisphaerica TaxID=252671 RepID=A0A7M5X7W0_9CNID
MLIPKEPKHRQRPTNSKRRPPLITKYIRQVGNDVKISVIFMFLLIVYITIGAFIFSHLEDCQQRDSPLVHSKVQKKTHTSTPTTESDLKSLNHLVSKYCSNISVITVVGTLTKEVPECQDLENLVTVNSTKSTPAGHHHHHHGDDSKKKECKETSKERMEKWFEYTFATTHGLGFGIILDNAPSKIASIVYSTFGISFTIITYTNFGSTILNTLKLLVVLIELKTAKKYKRYIKFLHFKCFFITVVLLVSVIVGASFTTASMNQDYGSFIDHFHFWWLTILTIGTRQVKFYNQKNTYYMVSCFVFIFVGMSTLAATILNLCQAFWRLRKLNKKRGRKGFCWCCCFDGNEEAVLYKDVAIQKWGSLLSINNASQVELRSLDSSMRIFENSNRVDSQCTIKRLSEIERDRHRSGDEGSDSDDSAMRDADDEECGIVTSPIMVTAAVATKRTVNDIS